MSGSTTIERGGIASFYVDGAYYQVKAQIDVKPGGMIRTAKPASDGTAGFTSHWSPPEVTLTAIDGPQVSITALKSISGSTVQVKQNNGKAWNLLGAFQVDDVTAKIADGDIDGLKFSGTLCQEILAQ